MKYKQIQWYPGHMAKTKRQIKERLKLIDVVFEIVDARAPLSTQNPIVDEVTKHKPRLILLNKADLADPKALDAFVEHFDKQGFKSLKINALSGFNVNKIVPTAKAILEEKFDREKKRGREERPIRALIVGIPNVGKSTLINRLVSKRAVKVGDVPGITKHLQMIRINKDLELLDTPGILWPKFDDEDVALKLALIGALKDSLLPLDDVVVYGIKILAERYKEAFEKRYDIEVDTENVLDIFDAIGKRRGAIKQGGVVDYDRVMDLFLYDFRHQQFGPIILDRVDEDV